MTPIQATMIQTWLLANQAGNLSWDENSSEFWFLWCKDQETLGTVSIALQDEGFEFKVTRFTDGPDELVRSEEVTKLSQLKALAIEYGW